MKRHSKIFKTLVITLLGLASTAAAVPMKGITIQNVNLRQPLSPPAVVVHKVGFHLFEIGKPASPAVISVAEEGMVNQIMELSSRPDVYKVYVFPKGIMPGQSAMMNIAIPSGYRISIVSMLGTTNDGFTGIDSEAVPARGYSKTYEAGAYDAGSEANTESCAHIPGPPCNSHNVRVPDGAEGFVHMHTGIRGAASLSGQFDWRGTVAKIKITDAD